MGGAGAGGGVRRDVEGVGGINDERMPLASLVDLGRAMCRVLFVAGPDSETPRGYTGCVAALYTEYKLALRCCAELRFSMGSFGNPGSLILEALFQQTRVQSTPQEARFMSGRGAMVGEVFGRVETNDNKYSRKTCSSLSRGVIAD